MQEAQTHLAAMCAASVAPIINNQELLDILRLNQTVDRFGNSPGVADWQPTFDSNRAAAEGWRRKAARCADQITVTVDGRTVQNDEVFKHCLQMAETYAKRSHAELLVSPPNATFFDQEN